MAETRNARTGRTFDSRLCGCAFHGGAEARAEAEADAATVAQLARWYALRAQYRAEHGVRPDAYAWGAERATFEDELDAFRARTAASNAGGY